MKSRRAPRDRTLLVALLIVFALGWTFAEIADEVFEGETGSFDEAVVKSLRSPEDPTRLRGPAAFIEIARDVTALGGAAVLTFVTVGVSGFLLLARKRRALVAILITTLGGVALSFVFKNVFDRPRPHLVPHLSIVVTSSFPSGHSTLAAVVYMTLAAMAARLVDRTVLKLYILASAVMITLAVGASRVALGVHYPTDVAAGWTLGAAWALIAWALMRKLQRERRVEQADVTTTERDGGP